MTIISPETYRQTDTVEEEEEIETEEEIDCRRGQVIRSGYYMPPACIASGIGGIYFCSLT